MYGIFSAMHRSPKDWLPKGRDTKKKKEGLPSTGNNGVVGPSGYSNKLQATSRTTVRSFLACERFTSPDLW